MRLSGKWMLTVTAEFGKVYPPGDQDRLPPVLVNGEDIQLRGRYILPQIKVGDTIEHGPFHLEVWQVKKIARTGMLPETLQLLCRGSYDGTWEAFVKGSTPFCAYLFTSTGPNTMVETSFHTLPVPWERYKAIRMAIDCLYKGMVPVLRPEPGTERYRKYVHDTYFELLGIVRNTEDPWYDREAQR